MVRCLEQARSSLALAWSCPVLLSGLGAYYRSEIRTFPSYFTVIFRKCAAVHLVLSAVVTIESSVGQLHLAFAQPLASRARLQGMLPHWRRYLNAHDRADAMMVAIIRSVTNNSHSMGAQPKPSYCVGPCYDG
jgi:hypothetical protein